MRFIFTLFLFVLSSTQLLAQAPQRISYQAVVRNSSNGLVSSAQVGMRISILQGSSTGNSIYAERHTPTTNENGLLTIEIGGGTVESGTFSSIPWANGPFFIKAETDPTGGSTYTITGTTQLLSVPYSLYANIAGNGLTPGTQAGQMLYWDGTKWTTLPKGSNGQSLKWCNDTLTWGPCIAQVKTLAVENISYLGADIRFAVINDGGSLIKEAGIIWSLGSNPQYPSDSAKYTDVNRQTGYYSLDVYNIEPQTKCYVRSFAINDAGISYGEILNFTTSSLPDLPTLSLDSVTAVSQTSAKVWGTIITRPLLGNSGIIIDTIANTSINRYMAIMYTGPSSNSINHTFQNLKPGTTYYVKAFGLNPSGTGYSNEATFKTDTISLPDLPTLSLDSVTAVSQTSAKVWGTIITRPLLGNSGIIIDTIANTSINRYMAIMYTGLSSNSINHTFQNLKAGTTYYVKAFGLNPSGTGYSNEATFKTDTISLPPPPPPAPTSLTDIDGNVYPVVKIANKHWISKNLDVTHYKNGDTIPQVQDPTAWANLTTGAWCYYENQTANGTTYGKLYNWYALNDSRGLAPDGWRVPEYYEWRDLGDSLGGSYVAGGKLKATTLWNSPNTGATNSTGFNGLPGGYRLPTGNFSSKGLLGFWWTPYLLPGYSPPVATSFFLSNESEEFTPTEAERNHGYSIRLIRNN